MNATIMHRGWIITPAVIGYDIQHPDYDHDNEIDWRHGHADTVEGARVEIDRLLAEDAEWTEAASILKTGGTVSAMAPPAQAGAASGEVEAGNRVISLLQGDMRRYGDALRQCRDQFAFYAREHEAAGKHEKAATNRRFAKIATDALEAIKPAKRATPAASGEIPAGMVEEQDWMQMARDAAASVRPNSPWAGRVHDGMRDDGDEVRSAMAAIAAVCAITTPKALAETGGIVVSIDDSLAFAYMIAEKHRVRANEAEARIASALNTLIQPDETWQAYALRLRAALSAAPSAPATEAGEEA